MKLLVTGANGFLGKNLVTALRNSCMVKDKANSEDILTIYEYDRDSSPELLDLYCADCDFVYHLAGVNRPQNVHEFTEGNVDTLAELLTILKKHNNRSPIVLSSSIQAGLDNPYGRSKKKGEELLLDYGCESGVKVYVYRFSNIFGKWCKPNYNSVVATFCHNIANHLPIQINNQDTILNLHYIDDVVSEMIKVLDGQVHPDEDGYYRCNLVYSITLGRLAELIQSFADSRKNNMVPDMSEHCLTKKLYATYISYLPEKQFSYPLKVNTDIRGSFTEILRTADRGQFSVNISKPGVTKGNHWHNTKTEKFAVVSGKALIQFRRIGERKIVSYHVSGENIEVVDIPPGYTHAIINEGDTDLITFMWCSECFDPECPDTFFEEVKENQHG